LSWSTWTCNNPQLETNFLLPTGGGPGEEEWGGVQRLSLYIINVQESWKSTCSATHISASVVLGSIKKYLGLHEPGHFRSLFGTVKHITT